MPTPVSVSEAASTPLSGSQVGTEQGPGFCEVGKHDEVMSHSELEDRFIAFLADDKNIRLCEAVQRFWINSGMKY